ncbi:MAG: ABC transporter ATP-binding protein [Tissierellales bacterium]|nr:ABC transporter ATP-binding protein [Tissierellales bacterium]
MSEENKDIERKRRARRVNNNQRGQGQGARFAALEKPKDFSGSIKRLAGYLKPYRIRMIIVVLMAIGATIFTVLSPIIMGRITTSLYNSVRAGLPIDFVFIRNTIFMLIGIYLVAASFSYLQQFLMAGVSQKLGYDLRKQANEKIHKLPLKYFDSKTVGEILSRVTNDIDTIISTMQQSITQLITSALTFIGILVMMLIISPVLTLITFVTIPLSIIITRSIAKRSQVYFSKQANALGELNGHVEESYTGHVTVKAYGREKQFIDEFNEINERLYTHAWKAQFISGIIMPLMAFVNNIGYVFVAVVGGIFVLRGNITIGSIQAFMQYTRQFTQPIVQTAEIINVLQATVASAERVFELLDEEEEENEENKILKLKEPKGEVEFRNVSFGYSKEKPLIKNMNIHVKPGETVAIVGPTGAGKTTIVNLLMRFYEIDDGEILIDGVNTKDMKREDVRKLFGMVLQDTWLFNGTIKENIAYGKENATDDEIIHAAKLAQADHFIRTLPKGYDTELNEEASNISQGQKQLLTIARAILANPTILILDEATSSVDTRTEILIQKGMDMLMKGRTSFVIAHRLSTIRNADIILVMNNGQIIEQGSHDELMKLNGFYADLYNSQFAA